MAEAVPIEFTVGKLYFTSIEAPAERLGMYEAPNEGNRNPCLATVIPPGTVAWTNEALKAWVEDDFLPMVVTAQVRYEVPERADLCQCGHQRQAHHDGETSECRYVYGADQTLCPCMGFEPASTRSGRSW